MLPQTGKSVYQAWAELDGYLGVQMYTQYFEEKTLSMCYTHIHDTICNPENLTIFPAFTHFFKPGSTNEISSTNQSQMQ
jgi:hypothetical protein